MTTDGAEPPRLAPTGARSRGSPGRRVLLGAGKWLIAAAIVGWLWRSGLLDPARLARVGSDPRLLGVLAGQLLSMGLPLLRWHLLLRAREVPISFARVSQMGLISYFAAILLPATGGQDLVRLYYARKLARTRSADILATILLDRFLGLLGLAVLGTVAGVVLAALTTSQVVTRLAWASAGAGALVGVIPLALVWTRPPWFVRTAARVPALEALLASLGGFRARKRALLASAGLGVLAQFGNCVSMFFGLAAVGTPVSLLAAMSITPLITLSGVLPLTPLGLGVMDGTAAGLFGLVGAAGGADAMMLLRGAVAVFSLLGGLAYLAPLSAPPEDEAGPPG